MKTVTSTRYAMVDSCWGRAISWLDYDKLKITGHLTPMIRVDDEVVSRMESGADAVFRVTKVERMSNPSDMFFADVEPVDYLKNLTT